MTCGHHSVQINKLPMSYCHVTRALEHVVFVGRVYDFFQLSCLRGKDWMKNKTFIVRSSFAGSWYCLHMWIKEAVGFLLHMYLNSFEHPHFYCDAVVFCYGNDSTSRSWVGQWDFEAQPRLISCLGYEPSQPNMTVTGFFTSIPSPLNAQCGHNKHSCRDYQN